MTKNKILKKEEELLRKEIKATQIHLNRTYELFENAIHPDLIDAYIYELNSIHLKYKLLLQELKLLQDEREKISAAKSQSLKPVVRLSQLIKFPAMSLRKLSS